MRHEAALRIDPLLLLLEIEAGNAETVDLVLLARRQAALDPDEGRIDREPRFEFGLAHVRQDGGQLTGGGGGVGDLARIGEQRGGLHVGCEHDTVAVENVGALHDGRCRGRGGKRRLLAMADAADFDQAHRDRHEHGEEQRAAQDQAGMADVEGALAVAVDMAAHRRLERRIDDRARAGLVQCLVHCAPS